LRIELLEENYDLRWSMWHQKFGWNWFSGDQEEELK